MTLDEAINREAEIAEKWQKKGFNFTHYKCEDEYATECYKYAEEHQNIAEWLKDYKRLLEQEPCEDAISREDAIKQCGFGMTSLLIADCLRKLPPVKPQTGHWILKIEDWNKWSCSECGYTKRTDIHVSLGYDFCPKCGARMVKPHERSDKE